MSLLDIYKEKNQNNDWFADHSTTGIGSAGRMFEYTNTNFRTQSTFTTSFKKFLRIENIPRDKWSKQADHGQEEHKHYVINMIQSKLFKKSADELYSRTAKGILYSDFISLEDNNFLMEGDKWFLNYLFLLNGYFFNRRNYILHRVKDDMLGYFLSVENVTGKFLIEEAKKLLKADSLQEKLRTTFFYFHSFYNDPDFLTAYVKASESEKEELALYIENNLKSKEYNCCISRKYKPSGSFVPSSLVDETKVFLLTLHFVLSKDRDIAKIYKTLVDGSNENIQTLTKKAVFSYIFTNRSVFDQIILDVLELEEQDAVESQLEGDLAPVDIEDQDAPEEYIDETSSAGMLRIKAIYNIRKRQARIQSGYKCALETINNCSPIYFTAKVSQQNYLELHHLLPREFRNDFSCSIEVLANYVTLCPRCHRQIHLAVDRERKHLINSLYEERKNRLQIVGLKIELKDLYQYYKIDA